jgi:hypothetical protein
LDLLATSVSFLNGNGYMLSTITSGFVVASYARGRDDPRDGFARSFQQAFLYQFGHE